jgi:hypothetical protein
MNFSILNSHLDLAQIKNTSFKLIRYKRDYFCPFLWHTSCSYQNKAEYEKLYKTQAKRDKAPHGKNQR